MEFPIHRPLIRKLLDIVMKSVQIIWYMYWTDISTRVHIT